MTEVSLSFMSIFKWILSSFFLLEKETGIFAESHTNFKDCYFASAFRQGTLCKEMEISLEWYACVISAQFSVSINNICCDL